MFKRYFILVLLLVCSYIYAVPPENLSLVKQQLIRYHDSGEYDYDISRAFNKAYVYLKKYLAADKSQKKLAIVFDIDETALSNYYLKIKDDFSSAQDIIKIELSKINMPVIPQTLVFYNFVKQHKISLFFITGRDESMRKSTIEALHNAGYRGWNRLYMRSKKMHKFSAFIYKTLMRKKISEMGYDIIINIGDQFNDLAGGYADHLIKLPNPYYLVP